MAKQSRKQRKKKHSRTELVVTGLAGHKQVGKRVLPPFAQMSENYPAIAPADWVGDRLPEMLWASMLIAAFGRDEALHRMRLVGKIIEQRCTDDDASRPLLRDVTLSGLAKWSDADFEAFAHAVVQADFDVFGVLLLFDDLPGKERWTAVLAKPEPNWEVLKTAVGITLWHQSQEATDCRWMRVLAGVLSRTMMMPTKELVRQVLDYPHYGDMRSVRPMMRAHELACNMTADGPTVSDWASKFWHQAYELTKTDHLPFRAGSPKLVSALTADQIARLREQLIQHWQNSVKDTSVDARLETSFGFAAYALDITSELIRLSNATSILGRMGLRTLVEATITFSHLAKEDNDGLWKRFRDYGYGQAKLAYLKMLETEELPSFITVEALEGLANEDVWHEFQTINVGNWQGADLRTISAAVGLKDDVYDRYYDWTSAFVHGNWAAQRDAVYALCLNPIHRLHRVLSSSKQTLPDVVRDAAILTNQILDVLHLLYPEFTSRLTVETISLA